MPRRAPQPDDLARLRIATDPRLSPDGRRVAFTVQIANRRRDRYRHSLWLAETDGDPAARQATLGAGHDRMARFSPDGRTLAFLSDRRTAIEDEPDREVETDKRRDAVQLYLLPLDGGEARRLTDLPRGVESFAWSPDGSRLVLASASFGATLEEERRGGRSPAPSPPESAEPPLSDFRYIDRLNYMLNGEGFTYDRVAHLWIVDVADGAVRRLAHGPTPEEGAVWSPDGTRIAFVANRRRNHDLAIASDLWVVDVASGRETRLSGGGGYFFAPAWLPDGASIAVLGGRLPKIYRNDLWLFAADGSDAGPQGGRNLSGRHDLMPGSLMGSDITVGESPRLWPVADGSAILFTAPIDGSYELWRIAIDGGAVERLTEGRHYLSGWDAVTLPDGGTRVAALRSSPTEPPDVWLLDLPAGGGAAGSGLRRMSSLNAEVLDELELRLPETRTAEVDGRSIQSWFIAGGDGARPLVTEIHGGPHTLYGWAPVWEFQVLAGIGIGVHYANPRGSEGYGEAFNEANLGGDWGDGPARDVLAGVEALIADGLADSDRLGITGGSYGGYLTNWIIGHDDRFAAAVTCRSVSEMATLMMTGDVSGVAWARLEFGAAPWEDPDLYRRISPLTYADRIRTPLLIQHAELDLRCTVAQAEMLFTVLREHRRPVRLLRVPDESHELTRSGTPFRRIENLAVIRDWFRHFLIDGRTRLPAVPRPRRR